MLERKICGNAACSRILRSTDGQYTGRVYSGIWVWRIKSPGAIGITWIDNVRRYGVGCNPIGVIIATTKWTFADST
ncbi:hypothetical protein KUH03_41095 [Sphingobacterium sp. E70]|uniref:hypothetical protein n=1 Tax=Sphingobacterium sp. E70 TaxID=2853439 RepID=UPI00211BA30F|nr:hypothetical protein [Sphingobacterium sp. E70]ULT25165.1 hypothetical protein KUH03_41095 [Sphingobacterium sp. E70]